MKFYPIIIEEGWGMESPPPTPPPPGTPAPNWLFAFYNKILQLIPI